MDLSPGSLSSHTEFQWIVVNPTRTELRRVSITLDRIPMGRSNNGTQDCELLKKSTFSKKLKNQKCKKISKKHKNIFLKINSGSPPLFCFSFSCPSPFELSCAHPRVLCILAQDDHSWNGFCHFLSIRAASQHHSPERTRVSVGRFLGGGAVSSGSVSSNPSPRTRSKLICLDEPDWTLNWIHSRVEGAFLKWKEPPAQCSEWSQTIERSPVTLQFIVHYAMDILY